MDNLPDELFNPFAWLGCFILLIVLCILGGLVAGGAATVIANIRSPGVCGNLDFNMTVSNAQVLLNVTNHNDFSVKFDGINTWAVRIDEGGQRHKHGIGAMINPGATEVIVLTEFNRLSRRYGVHIESVEKIPGGTVFKCNIVLPFSAKLLTEIESEYERACTNISVEVEKHDWRYFIIVTNNNKFEIVPRLGLNGSNFPFPAVMGGRSEKQEYYNLAGKVISLVGMRDRRQLFDYIECNRVVYRIPAENAEGEQLKVSPEPTVCNKATLLSEQTIQDGAEVQYVLTGSEFIERWTVRNEGTCTWTSEYLLLFSSGSIFDASPSLQIGSEVKPGETIVLELTLTAPLLQGRYHGEWKLGDENYLLFKDSDSLEVNVVVITADQAP